VGVERTQHNSLGYNGAEVSFLRSVTMIDRTRRTMLALVISSPILVPRGLRASNVAASSPTRDVGAWMDQALEWKSVATPLRMQRFADPIYILLDPIEWKPNKDQVGFPNVIVPRGFVSDLASIPPLFWSKLRPDGDYAYAAVVHDFLYWNQHVSFENSNKIFKMNMEDFELDTVTVQTLYQAVSHFGRSAWDANKKAKAAGERRILRDFPSDPKIKWAQWRVRADVFSR